MNSVNRLVIIVMLTWTAVNCPRAAELPNLPRVKITGTVHLPGYDALQLTAAAKKYASQQVETWLLDRSIISRVRGFRIQTQREAQSKTARAIEGGTGNGPNYVPYEYVVSYEPDDMTSPTDFPVRYFEKDFDPENMRISSMDGLSWAYAPSYPHWILQRAALAAHGLPEGTTSSRSVENGLEVINLHLPPKLWQQNYLGQERISCSFAPDKLVIEQFSRGWINGRTDEERSFLETTCSKFDSHFKAIPLRVEMARGGSMVTEYDVQALQEIPESDTFEKVLSDATQGMSRIFSQRAGYEDRDLSTTVFRRFDTKPIRLSHYRDKFLLLHFWASWAPDNLKRFEEVKHIVSQHEGNPEFAVISISLDADREAAQAVLAKVKPSWMQAYAGADAKFAGRFPFRHLPAAILNERADTTPGRLYDEANSALFGGEYSSSLVQVSAEKRVSERLALEARRRKAGGTFVEMLGQAGRDTLTNAQKATGFLLLSLPSHEPGMQLEVPQDVPQFDNLPILRQWPDVSRVGVSKLAGLLLDNGSYKSVHERDPCGDIDPNPRIRQRIALQFSHAQNQLNLVYSAERSLVTFTVHSGEKQNSGYGELILKPEAARKFDALIDESLPHDQETSRIVEQRIGDWRARHLRRLQDTVTSESLVPPVEMPVVWQGRGAIQLEWSNPGNHSVLIVRGEFRSFDSMPEHGRAYKVGDNIGEGRVVYSGTGSSHLDQQLKDGKMYSYKIYGVSGEQQYSSARFIQASAGDGLRIVNAHTFGESGGDEAAPPGKPRPYRLNEPPNPMALQVLSHVRIVGKPGQKPNKVAVGNDMEATLSQDEHPLVGGAATYTGEVRSVSPPPRAQGIPVGRTLPTPRSY